MSPIRIFFSGAENSEWRKFLADEGVDDVSLSYVKLSDRVKFAKPWTIAGHFSPGTHVLLDAGGYSYNKEDSGVTEDDAMDMANRYMAFVADNIDELELFTEFDANILGQDWLQGMREDFYNDLDGDKFIPIWRIESGRGELERLAARYERVGILKAGLTSQSAPLLNGVVRQFGVKLHGLGIADWELIKAIKFDSVSSGSWIKPSQYGETIIWDGHELKRYPARYKAQARNRHRSYIEQQGFDSQLIIDDDRKEVLRLSVWSWQQFMASLDRQRVMQPFGVTPQATAGDGEDAEPGGSAVDPLPPAAGNESLLPAVPEPRQNKLVPLVGIRTIITKNADDEDEEEPVMVASSTSLMRCNQCEIRDMCTEFTPDAECAFNFPAYVSTKTQMRSLQDFLIALQTQRVQRMGMIEQVKGGYADANYSAELDRLQRMIKHKQDVEKEGFTVSIQATGDGSTGAISRLFGKDVSDKVSELDTPVMTAEVMQDTGIVEGEIVSDGE